MTFDVRAAQYLVFLTLAAGVSCGGDVGGAGGGELAAPSNLKAVLDEGNVSLTWKSRAGDQAFVEIERKTTGAFFNIATLSGNATRYYDDTVRPGQRYAYRVRAVTETESSSYSNEAEIDVPADGSGGAGGMGGTGGAARMGGAAGEVGVGGVGAGGAPGAGGTNAGNGGSTGTGGVPKGGMMGSGGVTGSGGSPPPPVSFQRDIVPILTKTCGSADNDCHGPQHADGRSASPFFCQVAWLSTLDQPLGAKFSGGPNAGKATGCPDLDLYARLTQIKSMLCSGTPQRQRYVVARDLKRSLLYQVIAGDPSMGGTCTESAGKPVTKMPKIVDPPKNLPPLTPSQIQSIADWITQGALNN